MDRNYPVQVSCPRCGNDQAQLLPPLGYRSDYRCPSPRCGSFSISGTQERLLELGTADIKQMRFVEDDLTGRRFLHFDQLIEGQKWFPFPASEVASGGPREITEIQQGRGLLRYRRLMDGKEEYTGEANFRRWIAAYDASLEPDPDQDAATREKITRLNARIRELQEERRRISSDPAQLGKDSQLQAQIADLTRQVERLWGRPSETL